MRRKGRHAVSKLRLLLLEDSPLDAELILAQLADGGFECDASRVQTRADFEAALAGDCPDLILADFSLPSFDGVTALKLAQGRCPDVPFLFVSGAMGEEVAIETLKSGATDYVLKQRLERLVPAVRRALREAEERAERRRLEEALRQRAEELAEADRRKDEFLATLAHELRSPLATIRNAVQLMRLQGVADPTLERARDIVERQTRNLSRLVDDLLDLSRIGRDKMELRRERVDLSATAGLAVESARPLLDSRQHRLSVELAAEPLWLDADPVRLEQVITNLLNNAAKYTDPGGHVWLTTARDDGQAVLRVRDNGIGIPAELQARIFDLFMQSERALDRAQGGLGIGLTLVRRLVELHGGTIQVASPGAGRGSEFTVRLPLAVGPVGAAAAPAAAPEAAAAARTKRVMVVDDNRDGAESLAMLLRFWGHEPELAHDGPSAVELAEAARPDVVLLDIGLPGMDGYQVARRLRDRLDPRTMLVALTGYGQDEDRRRAREAGFDHHLIKPVDMDALRALLADSSAAIPAN
jgi:two-component system CheB/CheR fusion protein